MRLVLVSLALLLALPPVAGLGVLPPDPPSRTAPGLATVVFRIPVRYEADVLHVSTPGDPVGAAGLAPAGGTPANWTPLAADPRLETPPQNASCWRGYCGLAHVVVRLAAPNHDGTTHLRVALAANGTQVTVPLPVTADERRPRAHPGAETVRIEVPRARGLEAVRLRSPNGSWAAAGADDGFRVSTDRLPHGTPLTPTLVLRNGTTVAGDPVRLPEEPGRDPGAGPEPESTGNRTPANATDPPTETDANATGDDPGSGQDDGPGAEGPLAPARGGDDRRLPAHAGLAVAALAAAARATL